LQFESFKNHTPLPFLKEKTRNGGMKRGWDLLGGEGEQIS